CVIQRDGFAIESEDGCTGIGVPTGIPALSGRWSNPAVQAPWARSGDLNEVTSTERERELRLQQASACQIPPAHEV
ncbi:MAG: hypothetical protein ABIP94_01490, partial [Planctomycetota bacterium]